MRHNVGCTTVPHPELWVGGGRWEKLESLFGVKWSHTTIRSKLQGKKGVYYNGTIQAVAFSKFQSIERIETGI